MPFLVQPFVMKLQEKLDASSSTWSEGAEGDTMKPIPIPGQLQSKPPPGPPMVWATCWADATEAGCAGLIPPNTMLALGNVTQKGILLGATSGEPKYTSLKNSFVAQAAAILPGFLPTGVATPPPGPPPFESIESYGVDQDSNLPWMNACGVMLNDWYTKAIIIYNAGPTPMTWL
tara:strand:+ start:1899 stop:2423 length:525 start_codon:yes stop_codon:yes gene_type:complete